MLATTVPAETAANAPNASCRVLEDRAESANRRHATQRRRGQKSQAGSAPPTREGAVFGITIPENTMNDAFKFAGTVAVTMAVAGGLLSLEVTRITSWRPFQECPG